MVGWESEAKFLGITSLLPPSPVGMEAHNVISLRIPGMLEVTQEGLTHGYIVVIYVSGYWSMEL
jgi:hypothetical protein